MKARNGGEEGERGVVLWSKMGLELKRGTYDKEEDRSTAILDSRLVSRWFCCSGPSWEED